MSPVFMVDNIVGYHPASSHLTPLFMKSFEKRRIAKKTHARADMSIIVKNDRMNEF